LVINPQPNTEDFQSLPLVHQDSMEISDSVDESTINTPQIGDIVSPIEVIKKTVSRNVGNTQRRRFR